MKQHEAETAANARYRTRDDGGRKEGKDAAQGKSTFPALLGLDGTRDCLRRLTDTMREALAPFGERTAALAALGRAAVERTH